MAESRQCSNRTNAFGIESSEEMHLGETPPSRRLKDRCYSEEGQAFLVTVESLAGDKELHRLSIMLYSLPRFLEGAILNGGHPIAGLWTHAAAS